MEEALRYVGTIVVPKSHTASLLEPKVSKGSKPRYSLHKHNLAMGKVLAFRKFQRLYKESPEFVTDDTDGSADEDPQDWYEVETSDTERCEAGTNANWQRETDSEVQTVLQPGGGQSLYFLNLIGFK